MLNSFAQVFRVSLRTPATIATVVLAVALWLARRVGTVRRALVWGAGSGAVWAYVMPVPIVLIGMALMPLIPLGTAEYYYVDFRPMGLEVLESGKPQFRHYIGDAIPLRYRAELDGREIEVWIEPMESTSAHFNVRAVTPDNPLFVIERALPEKCGTTYLREKDNVITTTWSAGPGMEKYCYREPSPEAELTIRFTGSETSLTLHGPVVKAGEYNFYDSL